ncbi:hypothetical protein DdX_18890 [Ditylenchus destructor]|uniref:Uncharacterized protein n=1 Tax=Ditylenchus destructor TaxID=166010 RepID=A0AAD4MNN6_9BILA|nr:hypothetical protein DdX_18890 [Ditylenchus destructor]
MVPLVTSNYRFAFLLISGLALILWLATSVLMSDFYDNMTTLRQNEPMGIDRPLPYSIQETVENEVVDSCLRNKDPWNEEIIKYVNPSEKNKFDKTCKPMTQITQLIDSPDEKLMRLSIRPEYEKEYACQYRCLYPKDDYNYTEGFWISFHDPTQPPCDVFEVECKKQNDGSKKTDEDLFKDVYYQI